MSNVNEFMKKLASQQPKTKEQFQTEKRTVEKIYLNYPGNHGRYQIFPLDNVVTDYPFVTLFNTREVQISRKSVSAEGVENIYSAWIKILPKDAYIMKDTNGRVVSSLTAEEDQLLSQAYMVYDQLATELDARNCREEYVTKLIRKRNYTVFHAKCLNKWNVGNASQPQRSDFSGLFVCTAKGFVAAVNSNIEERMALENNDVTWIDSIYNNKLTDREGFLMFTIAPNPTQAGFQVSATHEYGRGNALKGIEISEEEAAMMKDPVASFLGWQAARETEEVSVEHRRLFNAPLMQETINFMVEQLTAIKMAKETGMDLAETIAATTAIALGQQRPVAAAPTTNDPMLATKMASEQPAASFTSAQQIQTNNTDPYGTPPVMHVDPISGAPTTSGFEGSTAQNAAPSFNPPAFAASGFDQPKTDDLPF